MNNYTVLFVDDEPFVLKSLQRLFRRDNLNLLTAPSGDEAWELVQQNEVHVLLTDNIMPGMTGVDLVRKVKDYDPRIIRMILSGHSDLEAVVQAVNVGEVFRFILKPWNDIDLKVSLHVALAHRKLNEDNIKLRRELQEKTRLLRQLQKHHPELFADLTDADSYTLAPENEASEAVDSVNAPGNTR